MKKKTFFICQAAMIAALYVVLTVFINAFNLANGNIQIRISEALTILPYFTPAAIPGLAIGCFFSNIFTGALLPDIIFGTLATLLGALGSYALRRYPRLVAFPPILANTLIVPLILRYAYHLALPLPFMMLTVAVGEIISCYILGGLLLTSLQKVRLKNTHL